MSPGINWIGTRYHKLARMLEGWGYDIVPDPTLSRWQEIVRNAPMTGLVLLNAEKDVEEVACHFKIKEFWEERNDGPWLIREGASLVRYHYHGWLEDGSGVRFCLFEEGHPAIPFHCHPWGVDTKGIYADPIEPDDALAEFEKEVWLRHGGLDVDDKDDA